MVTKETLLQQAKQELVKSLRHLNYSYQKTKSLNLNEAMLEDEETLESFEGLVSRFCRTSDIFISRYLRTYVMIQEPGFRGSLLDFLNLAEKLNLIEDAMLWSEIRELRNSSAHEYSMSNLAGIFQKFVDLTPHLLKLKEKLS